MSPRASLLIYIPPYSLAKNAAPTPHHPLTNDTAIPTISSATFGLKADDHNNHACSHSPPARITHFLMGSSIQPARCQIVRLRPCPRVLPARRAGQRPHYSTTGPDPPTLCCPDTSTRNEGIH